jgi:hypothetical protein
MLMVRPQVGTQPLGCDPARTAFNKVTAFFLLDHRSASFL